MNGNKLWETDAVTPVWRTVENCHWSRKQTTTRRRLMSCYGVVRYTARGTAKARWGKFHWIIGHDGGKPPAISVGSYIRKRGQAVTINHPSKCHFQQVANEKKKKKKADKKTQHFGASIARRPRWVSWERIQYTKHKYSTVFLEIGTRVSLIRLFLWLRRYIITIIIKLNILFHSKTSHSDVQLLYNYIITRPNHLYYGFLVPVNRVRPIADYIFVFVFFILDK